jgi:hypothetical protein
MYSMIATANRPSHIEINADINTFTILVITVAEQLFWFWNFGQRNERNKLRFVKRVD